jgi:hypothetical protein
MVASCPAGGQVFKDGAGNLVLRATRTATGAYRGALAGTFLWSGSWPPTTQTLSWAPPFDVTVRAKMTSSPALWAGPWWMSVNQTTAKGIFELDHAEQRTFQQTTHNSYIHYNKDLKQLRNPSFGCKLTLSSPLSQYHLYRMNVTLTSISFYADGRLCGTASNLVTPLGTPPLAAHRFGLLLMNMVPSPQMWGSGGYTPTGTGPWDMLVDYVAVTTP